MFQRKLVRSVAAAIVLCAWAAHASADPVRVTDGYIQVTAIGTDFLFRASGDVQFGGEHEGGRIPPSILSGMSGDIVNLSSSFADYVALSIFAPDPVDFFGRAQFEFTAGSAVVPPVAEVLASRDGVAVSAPFAFTGSLMTFSSFEDARANVNPSGRQDLFGSGTAQAVFRVQRTNVGEPLPDLPLVAGSIIYWFGEDPAPVPEPGTMLLLVGGMAATAARVRARRRNAPR